MNAHQRRVKLRKMEREAQAKGLPKGIKLSKANLWRKDRLDALKDSLRDDSPDFPGFSGNMDEALKRLEAANKK